jgi:hypothetical protein
MEQKKRGRWYAPMSRSARLGLVILAAAGIVAVPVALASHDFTDVPDASIFHSAISAVKTAGITTGKTCVPPGTPPTYCPSENITREAMAAFVQRGLPRIEQDTSANGTDVPEGTGIVNELTGSMTVGGVNGTQFVTVTGWATFDTTGTVIGPCEFRGWIVGDEGTADEVVSDDQFLEVEAGDGDIDATMTVAFSFIATSGLHNYKLKLQRFNGCTTTSVGNVFEVDETGIRIITTPLNQFGDGSTTLGTGSQPKPSSRATETE